MSSETGVRSVGRPAFKATAAQKRQVEELVSCGMRHADIARAVGCARETLEKHFAEELKGGAAKKQAEVHKLLWKAARNGQGWAIKQLVQMTALATVEHAPAESRAAAPTATSGETQAKQPRLGKKEEAALVAITAEKDTSWSGLVN